MQGFIEDLNQKARQNSYFREVLETGKYTQVVVMSIPPQGEIGEEVHPETDQILYLVEGEGEAVLNDERMPWKTHDLVLVHAGTKHNFINTGTTDLKIITTYSPPHHPDGTIHKTKMEADHAGY